MLQAFTDTFLSKDTSSDKKSTTNSSNPIASDIKMNSKNSKLKAPTTVFSQAEFSRQQDLIARLQAELVEKDAALNAALKAGAGGNSDNVVRRNHEMTPMQHVISDKGRNAVKLGTRGSLCTANVLESLNDMGDERTEGRAIAEKFLSVFQNPVEYASYLQSPDFASDVVAVCEEVRIIFENEPRCLQMPSPTYVFGDIHGNLEDLHFFADNIWKLGIDLTAGNFLFLGDYVDRGLNCLECVAYLFALKLLHPKKVFMLRGNHETRDVNGWEEHYAEKSFLYQCKDRFGVELGELVWEEVNQVFDRLPLAGVVDKDIFCIHGGIPRLIENFDNELDAIESVPSIAGIMPAYKHENNWNKQVAADCIWSDPASDVQEDYLNKDGFGDSSRGGGAVCFGNQAIDNFMQRNQLSYIIRAHEAHAHGVAVSKGARVFTVFSTSKDHRQGSQAMAGCILVDFEKIQVINRSPKYRNKYVHRRTSISLENMSEEEMENRVKLGLIRFSTADADYYQMKQAMAEEDAETQTSTQRVSFGNAK